MERWNTRSSWGELTYRQTHLHSIYTRELLTETFLVVIISVIISYSLKTTFVDRFYELRIHCPEDYPAIPPNIRFVTKINMSCVDNKTGVVSPSKLPAIKNWNRNMGIEQVLQSLRMEMCSDSNRRLRQPAEGGTF